MTDDDWRNAADAGFKIAAGGEATIRAWLAGLQASYPYSGSATEGPQAQFGRFFTWLALSAPPTPDSIPSATWCAATSSRRCRSAPTTSSSARRSRSASSIRSIRRRPSSASTRSACARSLRRRACCRPNHDELSNHAATFGADAAQELLVKIQSAMTLRDVETYLGAGRVQARLLMEQGFIVPFATTEERGQGGIDHAFAKRDLDDFLARLFDGAVDVAAPQPPAYSIQEAAKRANCGAGEIIRLILDKKLQWVGRLVSETGYAAVLVDAEEIKNHVRGSALDGLTANAIHIEMHTTVRVVNALIAAGHLPTERVINPLNRCPVDITSRADFDAFRQTYATLFDLARELGVHFRVLKARLTEQGIKPALDKETFGATFYKRADMKQLDLPATSRALKT